MKIEPLIRGLGQSERSSSQPRCYPRRAWQQETKAAVVAPSIVTAL